MRPDIDGDQTIGRFSTPTRRRQEVWSPLSYCPRSSLPAAVLAWLAARLAHLLPSRPPGTGGTPPLPLEVRLDAVAAVLLGGVHRGEPELVDEVDDRALGVNVVAGDRDGQPFRPVNGAAGRSRTAGSGIAMATTSPNRTAWATVPARTFPSRAATRPSHSCWYRRT
jgi:hypothetical protein